jgi:hypothetical protein
MDNDDISITLSNILDTITVSSSPMIGDISFDSTNNTYNVYTDNYDWITISDDNIDLNNISIIEPVEFEDTMPSVAKIEDMCKDYPALEKAYENFKTFYKMVHQDWVGRQDAES